MAWSSGSTSSTGDPLPELHLRHRNLGDDRRPQSRLRQDSGRSPAPWPDSLVVGGQQRWQSAHLLPGARRPVLGVEPAAKYRCARHGARHSDRGGLFRPRPGSGSCGRIMAPPAVLGKTCSPTSMIPADSSPGQVTAGRGWSGDRGGPYLGQMLDRTSTIPFTTNISAISRSRRCSGCVPRSTSPWCGWTSPGHGGSIRLYAGRSQDHAGHATDVLRMAEAERGRE